MKQQNKNWKLILAPSLKITDKKHSDGLRSGMRIVTMKKSEIQNNPIQATFALVVVKSMLPIKAR